MYDCDNLESKISKISLDFNPEDISKIEIGFVDCFWGPRNESERVYYQKDYDPQAWIKIIKKLHALGKEGLCTSYWEFEMTGENIEVHGVTPPLSPEYFSECIFGNQPQGHTTANFAS